ncbi:MAG: amino acid ABC transporter substrate-binding protein [Lachnospiraceae bacterium]
MKTKKILSLFFASVMLCAAVLTGCSQSGEETAVLEKFDLLSQIQERGEIVIAMEGTWAPWTYHDEADELVGYDVEVAKLVAEKLGVKPVFVESEWDGLLAGLDDGRYDIMVNGVGITPERQEKYDFSTPYAYNRTAVIVRGDYDEIHSMEDLSGKRTANTISSTYAEQAERYGAEVTGVDDLNQTIELLLSGRIDATLNAEVTFFDYLNAHSDANIQIAAYSDDVEQVAIPVRKGEETLLAAINEALAELNASGKLTELSEKYFGTDISQAS